MVIKYNIVKVLGDSQFSGRIGRVDDTQLIKMPSDTTGQVFFQILFKNGDTFMAKREEFVFIEDLTKQMG